MSLTFMGCSPAGGPLVAVWDLQQITQYGEDTTSYMLYSDRYDGCSYSRAMRMPVSRRMTGFLVSRYAGICDDGTTYSYGYASAYLQFRRVGQGVYEGLMGYYSPWMTCVLSDRLVCTSDEEDAFQLTFRELR